MINFKNIPNGHAYPLGATCYDEGVNFSLFSKNAERVELWLFDNEEDDKPSRVVEFHKDKNLTFYYWHIFIEGIGTGQLYGYKVYGPSNSSNGFCFDGDKLLSDPYTRAVTNFKNYNRELAKIPGDNTGKALKSVVIDPTKYDWEGDEPFNRPYSTSIIYEMHVKGLTAHESSGVKDEWKGTYRGLIQKIPYLKELGITAVELMPVQQFDPSDAAPGLVNYWGYSPISFFAPHIGYASNTDPIAACNEFRDMVKALHSNGIEVILDVVFNHTTEGDAGGPILSFKGIENKAYYILENKGLNYKNYSGCGNTLNANHSVVRRMIGDCLRSWVTEYHIDGFRFDLASVLSRDESGKPLKNPPVLWEIESDPVLSSTKIIAEAWDAAGLYQVGSFVGDRWAEWNGKYRDDIRQFMKGDTGVVSKFASRLIGSPDIYTEPDREPNRSIHFVTCHDGFTLNDLVSYNDKHNQDNGEESRDGANDNHSWNCGVEGDTQDISVNNLRLRQIKNFLTLTFISQGTPMLLMGDEVGRTQNGNNNAYCQDNDISYFNWRLVEQNKEILEFTKSMIKYTSSKKIFEIENLLATKEETDKPHISWHGVEFDRPDWSKNSKSLAFTLHNPDFHELIHVMVNSYWESLDFELPKMNNGLEWKLIVNTALNYPDDVRMSKSVTMKNSHFKVADRSIVILEAT